MLLERDPVSEAFYTVNNTSASNNHLFTSLIEREEHAKVRRLGKRAIKWSKLFSFLNGSLRHRR
jgi:hypothetical protein